MKLIRLGEIDGGMTDRLMALEASGRPPVSTPAPFPTSPADLGEVRLQRHAQRTLHRLDVNIGGLMANDEAWQLALACAREAHQCGLAEGVNFSSTISTAMSPILRH